MQYAVWDVKGRKHARVHWPVFYRNIHMDAVLFMLDVHKLADAETT